jgi:hypothetical protein
VSHHLYHYHRVTLQLRHPIVLQVPPAQLIHDPLDQWELLIEVVWVVIDLHQLPVVVHHQVDIHIVHHHTIVHDHLTLVRMYHHPPPHPRMVTHLICLITIDLHHRPHLHHHHHHRHQHTQVDHQRAIHHHQMVMVGRDQVALLSLIVHVTPHHELHRLPRLHQRVMHQKNRLRLLVLHQVSQPIISSLLPWQ